MHKWWIVNNNFYKDNNTEFWTTKIVFIFGDRFVYLSIENYFSSCKIIIKSNVIHVKVTFFVVYEIVVRE
jgi:hypothetical protein